MDELLNDVVLQGTRQSASLPPLPPKPQPVSGQLTANRAIAAGQPTNMRTVASGTYSQRRRERAFNFTMKLENEIRALQIDVLLLKPQITQLKRGVSRLETENTRLRGKISLSSARLSSAKAYCEELKREGNLLKQTFDTTGQQQPEASAKNEMENNVPLPVVDTNGPSQLRLHPFMGDMEMHPPFPFEYDEEMVQQLDKKNMVSCLIPVDTEGPNQKRRSPFRDMESGAFAVNANIGTNPEPEPFVEDMEIRPFPVVDNSEPNQFNYMNDFLMLDPEMLEFPFDIDMFI